MKKEGVALFLSLNIEVTQNRLVFILLRKAGIVMKPRLFPIPLDLGKLLFLDSLGKSIEIRIPYVPEYNDGQIEGIAHGRGNERVNGYVKKPHRLSRPLTHLIVNYAIQTNANEKKRRYLNQGISALKICK